MVFHIGGIRGFGLRKSQVTFMSRLGHAKGRADAAGVGTRLGQGGKLAVF